MNSLVGAIASFQFLNSRINIIYVKFNDSEIGF